MGNEERKMDDKADGGAGVTALVALAAGMAAMLAAPGLVGATVLALVLLCLVAAMFLA